MPICAELEAEISALTNDEKIEFNLFWYLLSNMHDFRIHRC